MATYGDVRKSFEQRRLSLSDEQSDAKSVALISISNISSSLKSAVFVTTVRGDFFFISFKSCAPFLLKARTLTYEGVRLPLMPRSAHAQNLFILERVYLLIHRRQKIHLHQRTSLHFLQ